MTESSPKPPTPLPAASPHAAVVSVDVSPPRRSSPADQTLSVPDSALLDGAAGPTDPAPAAPNASPPSIPPPQPKADPYIGATIDGRYKVEGLLGEGGMGVVYRGRHKVIDKPVAIKVLRADMARDAEITERFLREARAASAIGNPHIIDISDFGTLPDGSTYFVMEFLNGIPLSALAENKEPVAVTRLIRIAAQIADGLAAAHQRDIVHRDLKPDNIFLIDRGAEKDFVKILDFGIAKVSSGTAKLTRHGSVFGTPHYMSPEQAAGAPVDHRTDIYSLGVIMYEMASGKLPFDADNFMGILTQHMYQAPVPIRALVPPQDIPPGLEAIIMKCLSKKPEQRYQSMLELAEDLDKVTKGLVPDAVGEMMARSGGFNVPADYFKSAMPVPVPATPPALRAKNPWPLYAGIASVVAAVSIVVGIFAYGQYSTASPSPSNTPPPLSSTPAPLPVASLDAHPASTSAAPKPPGVKTVLVVASPIDAIVFLGDTKLGVAPREVDVPEGKTVQVTVRADGYHDQVLTLDGSEGRKDVILRPKGSGARQPPATTKTADTSPPPTVKPPPTKPPSTSTGGGEIVNPWAH